MLVLNCTSETTTHTVGQRHTFHFNYGSSPLPSLPLPLHLRFILFLATLLSTYLWGNTGLLVSIELNTTPIEALHCALLGVDHHGSRCHLEGSLGEHLQMTLECTCRTNSALGSVCNCYIHHLGPLCSPSAHRRHQRPLLG